MPSFASVMPISSSCSASPRNCRGSIGLAPSVNARNLNAPCDLITRAQAVPRPPFVLSQNPHPNPMSESFCASTNEEFYPIGHCASREDAVFQCVVDNDLAIGDTVFTGVEVPFAPEDHVDSWQIIEHLGEAANEHAGEAGEDWLDPRKVTPEQRADLERRVGIAIVGWLSEHNLHPAFWGVGGVEKHVVTADDLPAASPSPSVVPEPSDSR